MNWIRAIVLGAGILSTAGCSPAAAFNQWQFARLCDERGGVQKGTRFGLGGVRSDDSNLGHNLWLLFDFGAPFVEFERRALGDERLVLEWGDLPEGGAKWRLDRRPSGDESCAVFERWLSRVSREDFGYDALPTRWRNRASYRGQCLSLTFRSHREDDIENAAIRYFLRTDAGRVRQWGCDDVSERRYALVDRWGRRALVINGLQLAERRCHVDGPGRLIASCGDPVKKDLSLGREWFVDDSTPEARAALSAEQN